MPPVKDIAEAIADDCQPPCSALDVRVSIELQASPASREQVIAAVQAALQHRQIDHAEISVAIVDDPTIHQLNRQFLEHDYATDVLSFSLSQPPERLFGEVIVSADTAAREAAAAGWAAADELLLYVVHGTLHLAGLGDKTPEDESAMRKAELAVLAQLGVQPAPGDDRWRAAPSAVFSAPPEEAK